MSGPVPSAGTVQRRGRSKGSGLDGGGGEARTVRGGSSRSSSALLVGRPAKKSVTIAQNLVCKSPRLIIVTPIDDWT